MVSLLGIICFFPLNRLAISQNYFEMQIRAKYFRSVYSAPEVSLPELSVQLMESVRSLCLFRLESCPEPRVVVVEFEFPPAGADPAQFCCQERQSSFTDPPCSRRQDSSVSLVPS